MGRGWNKTRRKQLGERDKAAYLLWRRFCRFLRWGLCLLHSGSGSLCQYDRKHWLFNSNTTASVAANHNAVRMQRLVAPQVGHYSVSLKGLVFEKRLGPIWHS